jgi:hypothetical protein
MRIIKIHNNQKKEAPSSLNNRKKYVLRSELTPEIRMELGIMGLNPAYRSCTIKELETKYGVSHTFIYNQSNILKKNAAELFSISVSEEDSEINKVLGSIRFFLECKLETKGALHGLSNLGKSLSIPYHSTNFISELISVAGHLVGGTGVSEQPLLLTFLCDEIYSGGQAILVTIEAQSMMVLDIRLVEGNLESIDWEESYNNLITNNLIPKKVIKDQGVQMAAAAKSLPKETIIGADVYHAVSHRLGLFSGQYKKSMEKMITKEADRAARFAATKTYETALKKEVEWDKSKIEMLKSIDEHEWFKEHYFELIQQLRPFTSMGEPRDKAVATIKIKAALEALSLLDAPKLNQQIKYIYNILDNGQLLHYMDEVSVLHQQLQSSLKQETTWLWMLYWQWDKKSYQTHSPKVQQRAKQEAAAAKELLEKYYGQSIDLEVVSVFESTKKKVFSVLNEIVQASSLVEAFNSILRPFINSAKGQVSQELLNLVMFYHNHRVFKRGKRQGKAPIELLTGQTLQKSWIDILMDKVEVAFKEHQVTSLKELKRLLGQEKEPNNPESEQDNPVQQNPLAA